MKPREELKSLITESKNYLRTSDGYLTDGTKDALSDMVGLAERALRGEPVPFVRNREFFRPPDDCTLRFALRRYTMAPTYLEGKVYSHYGLREALKWAKTRDMRNAGKDGVAARAELAKRQAAALLQTPAGGSVGCVPPERKDALSAALRDLRGARSSDETAKSAVRCLNEIRRFRFSIRLRSDLDPKSNLFFSAEEFEKFRNSVFKNPERASQFELIKKKADEITPEQSRLLAEFYRMPTDYKLLNEKFRLWSSSDKIINFTAPENAVSASLRFFLPSRDNVQSGIGRVFLDNVAVIAANGRNWDLENPGFDRGGGSPDGWRPVVLKGTPVLRWEKNGVQPHTLSMENPTENDEGGWEHCGKLPVTPGSVYTLVFEAKIDGKPQIGLTSEVGFYDAAGKPCGSIRRSFKRKSSLSNFSCALSMQCDSIVFAVTGDRGYAEKAKNELLYTLNDFCQGAEHWMVTNKRPEGCDAYGAVQCGRILCSAACTYMFLRDADVFSLREKDWFYRMLEYLLRYVLDLRDRTELPPEEARRGCSNWQMDMCAGTGMMMLAVGDDFPNRKSWLYNALSVLRAQLTLSINPDGSWPESIRYHNSALSRISVFAKVLRGCTGEDWFSETGLARMFRFTAEVQTPTNDFLGGISTPPFGDHVMGGGEEFSVFAPYFSDVARFDRQLADTLYFTWRRAGSPMPRLFSEEITLCRLLAEGGSYRPREGSRLTLPETVSYPDAGIYLFRKNALAANESLFAVMSSPKPVGHGHLDQGSFMIWKNRIPIVADTGVEGYFDGTVNWHLCSYSHACMQFSARQKTRGTAGGGEINLTAGTYSQDRGWFDTPRSSKVLAYRPEGPVKSICIQIENSGGTGTQIRQIFFAEEPELYIINDVTERFGGTVLFNLPVVSECSELCGSSVFSRGFSGVDLQTEFLGPLPSITLERGRSAPMYPSSGEVCELEFIRAQAQAEDGITAVLFPVKRGEKGFSSRQTETGWLITAGTAELVLFRGKDKLLRVQCSALRES